MLGGGATDYLYEADGRPRGVRLIDERGEIVPKSVVPTDEYIRSDDYVDPSHFRLGPLPEIHEDN